MKTTQTSSQNSFNKTEQSRYLIGLALALIGAMLFSVRPILHKFAYQDGVDSVTFLTL